jgi:TonB family protein
MHTVISMFLALLSASLQAATPAPAPSADPCSHDATVKHLVSPNVPASVWSRYPLHAERVAEVKVTVGTDGRPLSATIFQSSGDTDLDAFAIQAAQRSAFEPKVVQCRTVVGDYLMLFRYNRNQ